MGMERLRLELLLQVQEQQLQQVRPQRDRLHHSQHHHNLNRHMQEQHKLEHMDHTLACSTSALAA
jgi:hypothetical protein